MIELISFALGGVLAGTVWLGVCNDRTYRHRMRMNRIAHDHNVAMIKDWRFSEKHGYPDDFVTYNEHLWRLFAFLDPFKVCRVRGWRLDI